MAGFVSCTLEALFHASPSCFVSQASGTTWQDGELVISWNKLGQGQFLFVYPTFPFLRASYVYFATAITGYSNCAQCD